MWYYQSKKDDTQVIYKLSELAEQYPTRGFDEYYNKICREGLIWNRKRVLRVYRLIRDDLESDHFNDSTAIKVFVLLITI
ncbi:hypothetical protein [Myroides sp. LoEW2-1]|uniref:hypothetical protein n=1 Tax=Myroides sp. LoEW2-1 TaxID=2683192 RepID=UPI0013291481|nr:hypothetical protein [Myroides sp. LoEW2-1]MVX37013.1 hypothetical protein [Myroides sp. LoEW2-1]